MYASRFRPTASLRGDLFAISRLANVVVTCTLVHPRKVSNVRLGKFGGGFGSGGFTTKYDHSIVGRNFSVLNLSPGLIVRLYVGNVAHCGGRLKLRGWSNGSLSRRESFFVRRTDGGEDLHSPFVDVSYRTRLFLGRIPPSRKSPLHGRNLLSSTP